MRIYIAGPMTGLPDYNYPAFHAAAAAWRDLGWDVRNPAEHFGGDQTRTYSEYVEADLAVLKTCNAIAMLEGWDSPNARGSVWEHFIAKDLLNMDVFMAASPIPPPRFRQEVMCEFIEAAIPLDYAPGAPIPLIRRDGVLGRYSPLESDL